MNQKRHFKQQRQIIPTLMSDTKSQTQETQKTPSRINSKNSTPELIFKVQIANILFIYLFIYFVNDRDFIHPEDITV